MRYYSVCCVPVQSLLRYGADLMDYAEFGVDLRYMRAVYDGIEIDVIEQLAKDILTIATAGGMD